jgi:hypothetical protein
MPDGWPIAMAPRLTLSRSSGIPSLSRQYTACDARRRPVATTSRAEHGILYQCRVLSSGRKAPSNC